MNNISEGDMTQKNWFQNLSEALITVNLVIFRIFEVKKVRLQNIAIKWHKIEFFLKIDLNIFRQDIKKICLLIAML